MSVPVSEVEGNGKGKNEVLQWPSVLLAHEAVGNDAAGDGSESEAGGPVAPIACPVLYI